MNTDSRLVVLKLAATCALATAACGDPDMNTFAMVGPTSAGGVVAQPTGGTAGASGSGPTTVPRAYASIMPLAVMVTGAAGSAGTPAAGSGGAAGAAGMAAAGSGGASAGAGGAGGAGASGASAGTGGRAGSGGAASAGRGGAAAAGRGGAGGATAGRGGSGGAAAGAGGAAAGASGAAAGASGAAAGAGGMAGMASAATAGSGGTRAIPTNLNGTATFNTTSSGVDLSVMVTGCIAGKSYPIHIHEGMSCESTMAQGAHWGPTRGEGIPDIVCGTGGVGSTMVSRAKTDPMLEWSLGDMRPSDVIGHVIVIHDADEKTLRLACGKVTAK